MNRVWRFQHQTVVDNRCKLLWIISKIIYQFLWKWKWILQCSPSPSSYCPGRGKRLLYLFALQKRAFVINPLSPSDGVHKQKKNILEDLLSSVLSQLKKNHPPRRLKFYYLSIYQSLKLRISMGKKPLNFSWAKFHSKYFGLLWVNYRLLLASLKSVQNYASQVNLKKSSSMSHGFPYLRNIYLWSVWSFSFFWSFTISKMGWWKIIIRYPPPRNVR